jgi:integrase/recombinase XerC
LQTARNFNKQIKTAAQRAELNPNDFSTHRFRHGAAYSILRSELGNSYVDKLVLVQQTFGHRQIKTTEIYASIPPAVLEQLSSGKTIVSKYEEAKRIFDATYLSPRNHVERRGHR